MIASLFFKRVTCRLTTRCLSLFLDATTLEHVRSLKPDMVLHDAQFLVRYICSSGASTGDGGKGGGSTSAAGGMEQGMHACMQPSM
jgi:hypothetical protein